MKPRLCMRCTKLRRDLAILACDIYETGIPLCYASGASKCENFTKRVDL